MFNKTQDFRTYYEASVNRTGYEHVKVMIVSVVTMIKTFKDFRRTAKTLGLEVETLIWMRDDKVVKYLELPIGEVQDTVANGGSIVDTFLSNILYTLSKSEDNAHPILKLNQTLLKLEDVNNKYKKLL